MTRHLAVFNAGSSSLKFGVYETASLSCVARGKVESIGSNARLVISKAPSGTYATPCDARTPEDAAHAIFQWLEQAPGLSAPAATAHRIVHGGMAYRETTLVTDAVIRDLETFIPLAPLHQPHGLAILHAARRQWPHIPHAAGFDTAFHHTRSETEQRYALPEPFFIDGIRRYGFHGLSYAHIARNLAHIAQGAPHSRVIVAHLGNGASVCALKDGRSVATSMGFSALEGLMMGTRSGSIDPGVLLFLLQEKNMSPNAVSRLLYHESGLKGVSGISADMRDLFHHEAPSAKRALELFCVMAARHIGALLPTLEGLDGLIFTGGIGEHHASIRNTISSCFQWLGLHLDEQANNNNNDLISQKKSAVWCRIVPADEEAELAFSLRIRLEPLKTDRSEF